MNKRTIVVIVSIAVIAVVVFSLLALEIQNPQIFCYAEENDTSGWYKTEKSPALCDYYYSSSESVANYSSLPNVNLGVRIFNDKSKSLFNVAIEVSYRTTENKWNTARKTDLGFLDIKQYKQTQITLTNPYLSLWHTSVLIRHGGENPYYTMENVTLYVLDASDYKMTAYGFAKP